MDKVSMSAMDKMTRPPEPSAVGNGDAQAGLLDVVRERIELQRLALAVGREKGDPQGAEHRYMDEAENMLREIEGDIGRSPGAAEAGLILRRLFDVEHLLGVAAGTRGGLRRKAREAGKKGHVDSIKAKAKAEVRACWGSWWHDPALYRGKAAFARAMLEKYPALESAAVIERWCREWEKEDE